MSEVLKGQTRNGDMVHATQNMSADQGFKCVSRLWYDKTQPLSAGLEQLSDDARQREDIVCPMRHMGIGHNEANEIVLEYIDGREFTLTPHALNQFSLIVNTPITFTKVMLSPVLSPNGKVKFNRDLGDMDTLVNVFKNGLRHNEPDKEYRFRTYTDGTMRAVLSTQYATINNIWYLEVLDELFRTIGGDEPRLSHWRGDADTIYGNILIPDSCRAESDSDYGGMFSVSNCEIGIRRLSQYPSVFRAICMNGCIWDQISGSKLSQVHRGTINLNDLKEKIVKNIHHQIPLLDAGVKKFLAMRDFKVDKGVLLGNVFALVAQENKLSYGLTGQAAQLVKTFEEFESNDANLFGVVNTITRVGQMYDNDEWVRFDEIAGKYMNYSESQWDAFQTRAKGMDAKEVKEKIYGMVSAA